MNKALDSITANNTPQMQNFTQSSPASNSMSYGNDVSGYAQIEFNQADVSGNDSTWQPVSSLGYDVDNGWAYKDLAARDWPGALAAAKRSHSQEGVALNGIDDDGKPRFRWK